jgi:hypothetical protein
VCKNAINKAFLCKDTGIAGMLSRKDGDYQWFIGFEITVTPKV